MNLCSKYPKTSSNFAPTHYSSLQAKYFPKFRKRNNPISAMDITSFGFCFHEGKVSISNGFH